MIIINNPNNPAGATIHEHVLQSIVDFAKARNILVFADEVYRPLFHSLPTGTSAPPSILSFGYEHTVSTSSMSKAWSLAGVRVGWIATRDTEVLKAVESARNYTTISVSQLDDAVAGYALSNAVRPGLLSRNLDLAKTNCDLIEEFVKEHADICSWVKPTAGTTAFVRFQRGGRPVQDGEFCLEILEKAGVLVMPGSTCFGDGQDFEGYMRFGYVCSTEVLKEALEKLGAYLKTGYLERS
jgi:aspartate/methionine/tyrosine aminotransferase